MPSVLEDLENYYDAAPRATASAENLGPLTLFVGSSGGPGYYARPALGTVEVTVEDVRAVLERQRQLAVPRSFEWVGETTPSLEPAVRAAGLEVHAHPLMILTGPVDTPQTAVRARVLPADDADVTVAVAVAQLGFGQPGTERGGEDPARLRAKTEEMARSEWVSRTRRRIAEGQTTLVAGYDDGQLIASGQHNPVSTITEIVGVATLPAARRRGAGLAVTARLVQDARERGIATVFLSASDDAVARIYARAGFERIGTAFIAETSA